MAQQHRDLRYPTVNFHQAMFLYDQPTGSASRRNLNYNFRGVRYSDLERALDAKQLIAGKEGSAAPAGYYSTGQATIPNFKSGGSKKYNLFKPIPTPQIQYQTDPQQAQQITDLQSRLDALTQSTQARELEIANAPKPVQGITQDQVNSQLANLRSTLGSQYSQQQTQALGDLRSQLSGQYQSQMNTLRQTLGQQTADQLSSQRSLFETNIGALRSELSTTRTGYESQIGGLQERIKQAQEADIQRQQRARVADAYANPSRQKVTGVKAARSPQFASTGARRTVSSQFGRSGMRISSLNI